MLAKGKLNYRPNALGWFLTYPKCSVAPQVLLEYLREHHVIVEYVISQEKHQDGTDHLHAFIKLDKRVNFKKGLFDIPSFHGNYQVAKSWNAVKQYVVKGGNYITNLDLDSAKAKKGKRNMELLACDPKEALANGDITIFQLESLIRAKYAYSTLMPPYEHSGVRGLWYHGPPGAGKSRAARADFPGAYLKPQNKWWDGYTGQKAVILDDFDHQGTCLGHYLKIWADRYACCGETKGSKVSLQHEVFVITSNYTPQDLWPNDREICEAISRRFTLKGF